MTDGIVEKDLGEPCICGAPMVHILWADGTEGDYCSDPDCVTRKTVERGER